MKNIKVLGTGCPSCIRLENNVKLALEKCGIDANVEKITDIADIMAYGVMGTPALVIDDKVVSSGKVNEVDEIFSMLNESEGCCSDKDVCDIRCSPKNQENKSENSGGCSCGGNC